MIRLLYLPASILTNIWSYLNCTHIYYFPIYHCSYSLIISVHLWRSLATWTSPIFLRGKKFPPQNYSMSCNSLNWPGIISNISLHPSNTLSIHIPFTPRQAIHHISPILVVTAIFTPPRLLLRDGKIFMRVGVTVLALR